MATAFESAKEQDLKLLVEECSRELELHPGQVTTIWSYLEEAWFFGVRAGHAVMVEAKPGQPDPDPVALEMREEFQDLMEGLADDLGATVGVTICAWDYLGRAWIDGARFWSVEITARQIEASAVGLDEALRHLQE